MPVDRLRRCRHGIRRRVDGRHSAGYRLLHGERGRPIAVWYPSAQPERPTTTTRQLQGSHRESAPGLASREPVAAVSTARRLAGCSRCSSRKNWRGMATWCRAGHRDASLCSIEPARAAAIAKRRPASFSSRSAGPTEPQRSPQRPARCDRRGDDDAQLMRVVDAARKARSVTHSRLRRAGARSGVAGVEISLGRCVVAMSPTRPFLAHDTLRAMTLPYVPGRDVRLRITRASRDRTGPTRGLWRRSISSS